MLYTEVRELVKIKYLKEGTYTKICAASDARMLVNVTISISKATKTSSSFRSDTDSSTRYL